MICASIWKTNREKERHSLSKHDSIFNRLKKKMFLINPQKKYTNEINWISTATAPNNNQPKLLSRLVSAYKKKQ